METTREASSQTSERELVDDYLEYKQVEDALACPVVDIRHPTDQTISIVVDTPTEGQSIWEFEKPYIWGDDNEFSSLCSQRGYTRETFDLIIDDLVLVQRNDPADTTPSDTNQEWQLILTPPDDYEPTTAQPSNSTSSSVSSQITDGFSQVAGFISAIAFTLGIFAMIVTAVLGLLTIGLISLLGRKIVPILVLVVLIIILL